MECERVHGIEMCMFNVWEGVSADSACYCDIWVYFGVEMVGKRGGAGPSAIERV